MGKKNAEVLTKADAEAILKSVHRVLRNKKVEHPVRLQFATTEGNRCVKWECKTVNGRRVCSLVPC